MAIKRVILANHSRLLLEMFQHVLNKRESIEVVGEISDEKELPLTIQRFCPDWVIISLPISNPIQNWISTSMQNDPSIRFLFFSDDYRNITIKWEMASEQILADLSLKEFIYILEKDFQHIE